MQGTKQFEPQVEPRECTHTHSKINTLSETFHPALLCSCRQKWQSLISHANGTWHFQCSDTEAVNKKPVTTRLSRVFLVPKITGDTGGSSHQFTKKIITNCCFHSLQAPRTPIMLMSEKKKKQQQQNQPFSRFVKVYNRFRRRG